MKQIRLKHLVFTALVLIVVGVVGVALTVNREFFYFMSMVDFQRFDPPPVDPVRYELRDLVIVDNHATMQIQTNGGKIHVHQSITDKVEIVLYVPYKPRTTDMTILQRNGTTISYDSATVWKELTGNVSQPIIDVDISVPAGSSLEIRTSMSDITLDANVAQVDIAASFGTLELPATHIDRLDATYTVGGKILGNAPYTSSITMNAGDIDMYVDQPGSHTIRVTRGDIALTLRKSLHVTTTQSAPNGAFYSQLTTPNASNPNVYLYLNTEVGNITLIPRE